MIIDRRILNGWEILARSFLTPFLLGATTARPTDGPTNPTGGPTNPTNPTGSPTTGIQLVYMKEKI